MRLTPRYSNEEFNPIERRADMVAALDAGIVTCAKVSQTPIWIRHNNVRPE